MTGAPELLFCVAFVELMVKAVGRTVKLSVEHPISAPCVTRIRALRTAFVGALMVTLTRPPTHATAAGTVCV